MLYIPQDFLIYNLVNGGSKILCFWDDFNRPCSYIISSLSDYAPQKNKPIRIFTGRRSKVNVVVINIQILIIGLLV